MQKFFTTTIISKFIKYLLMCTPLPICSFIEDLDLMISGRTYLYNNKFYHCTKTGVFTDGSTDYYSKLYCSDALRCSEELFCTDKFITRDSRVVAKFKEVGSYLEDTTIPGLTEDFVSTSSLYDSETHRKLGDYLRLLKSTYKLDLMSLYNCFNNYFVDNIDLSSGNLSSNGNPDYTVTLVPIKFNKDYTIAMNTSSNVFIKPVLYKGKLLRYPDKEGPKEGRFVYDYNYPTIYKYGQMKYSEPIKIRVENMEEYSQSLERYLYLAIQFPASTSTRITVIEGDAKTHNYPTIYDYSAYTKLSDKDLNNIFSSASSLLGTSDHGLQYSASVPFADRLIEYLIQHAVDNRDIVTENISAVTGKFDYKQDTKMWNKQLRGKLFDSYMKLEGKYSNLNFKDILGYVDSDIEGALDRGYLKDNV